MKRYILYFIPLLAILTSCEALDKTPLDAVSSEVYFRNASQLQQYSNQFYTLFPSAEGLFKEVSDQIALSELAEEVRGARDIPADASGTNWNWSMLRHINYLLEHIDQCSDETAAKEYEALARFFRAYFYYIKIQHYGDVPWIDRTIGNAEAETYAVRESRKVVMQHVIEDLDFAIENMTSDVSNVYRVNRYTAMALKSRACLFEGTFRKYHNLGDWEPMLEQSVDASKKLMDAGIYQLYTKGDEPYRALFTMGKVQGCSEYILARCYSLDLKLSHNVNYFTQVSTDGHPGFTKRLVNQYLCADGSRFTDKPNYQTIDLGTEMTNRDPRMEQTIFRPGHYKRIGSTTVENYKMTTSSTGYQLIKYVMGKSNDTYNTSDCDMPLFRLAEVYLNYAEAKAELGTFTQADADMSINLLRDRVQMPHLNVADAEATPCQYLLSLYPNVSTTNTGVILEIRRERSVELVQEGFRYWDLMRWKEGKAFEQPYLGIAFPGVSKSESDYSGCVDFTGDGIPNACAYYGTHPFAANVLFIPVGTKLVLSNGLNGGNVLNNGTPENPNGGRKWNEERDYLYPVPIRERVLSNGKLTQNPGWDDGLAFE